MVHLLWAHNLTDHATWLPHGCCMGERGLVRSWCGFRGVGCWLWLMNGARRRGHRLQGRWCAPGAPEWTPSVPGTRRWGRAIR